jgi:PAS domain S-box-containing protein
MVTDLGQARDRHQLQQIIAGLSEGVILIEPGQRIVWGNEAALAMHGVESLEDLGATVDAYRRRFRLRYRNNHILKKSDYPLARVIAGETFSDVTVEVCAAGRDERWVHSIRSQVVTYADGQPDCLVLIITDVTEQYEAEARFESAFNANPAPAAIARLSDRRYIKVNQGFLEMTGFSREDILAYTLDDFDVLNAAEQRDLALERLAEGRTIPQMEACIPLPTRPKFVIVAGQPIEVSNEACILFTFADLDPRKETESALRQSEQRFSTAFRLVPVPIAIAALDHFRLVEVNDAFREVTGFSDEQLLGRTPSDLGLWPDDTQQRFNREIKKTHGIRGFELEMRAKNGERVACLVSAEAVAINDDQRVLCVLQDVTDRKRSEEELIAAIEQVMADTSWFSRSIVEKLAALRRPVSSPSRDAELEDLTGREREVLGLICQGRNDAEIGDVLKLSRNTVRNHLASLYRKLGVNRRAAAIVWARERGITGQLAPKKRPRR